MTEYRPRKRYQRRYIPGLDGLRALAVISIILFHLNSQLLPGGFLGVDTFFVISGYLITALLISEYKQYGYINLMEFWIKRMKRLLPAVLFMMGIVLSYTVFFEPEIIKEIKSDVLAAVFYVSNWWYILQDLDYFNQFSIEPLKHLWSLAVEEQFYLLYPILLLVLLKSKDIKFTFYSLVVVSILSAILMITLTGADMNLSRVYFGTDTRLQTLLLGSILAIIWPPFRLKVDMPKKYIKIIDSVGVVSIFMLVLIFFKVSDNDLWLYNGGFFLISLITLLVISSAVVPSGYLSRVLGNHIFVFIGKRSYSLYLWHYPIIVFVHSYFVAGQIPFYVYLIDIVLMLLFTEFSYRFIERPIRQYGVKAFSFSPNYYTPFIRLTLVVALMIPTILMFIGQFDEKAQNEESDKATSFKTEGKRTDESYGSDNKKPEQTKDENESKNEGNTNDDTNSDGEETDKQESGEASNDKSNENQIEDNGSDNARQPKELQPLLLGDSVVIDIGQSFINKAPNASIDGVVGRQFTEALDLINGTYNNFSHPGKEVVIHLGTNGRFTKEQLDSLIQSLNGADIYLVTIRVPRDYESYNNSLMYEASKQYDNVYLVDWYKDSEGHPEYFANDGIHLEYSGKEALTNLIIDAMLS